MSVWFDEPHPWPLIAYNTPKQPSTARVTAWRRLHRLGALYIGPSTCLLPAGLTDEVADAAGRSTRAELGCPPERQSGGSAGSSQ
jgi:hypothetical protein